MITGEMIANSVFKFNLLGIPYSTLDCQAFVEKVLWSTGLKTINYRGSNHMWRDLVYDRTEIDSSNVDNIPAGALVFKLAYDGGETKRGYHDDMGNAYHVGISLSDGTVAHSTKGGSQLGKASSFTHYALIKDVDYDSHEIVYSSNEKDNTECMELIIDEIYDLLESINGKLKELEGYINADE